MGRSSHGRDEAVLHLPWLRPLSEYDVRKTAKDGLQARCRSCSRAWCAANREAHRVNVRRRTVEVRREYKRRLGAHLSEHCCVDCGESDVRVLEFDHRPGSTSTRTWLPWWLQADVGATSRQRSPSATSGAPAATDGSRVNAEATGVPCSLRSRWLLRRTDQVSVRSPGGRLTVGSSAQPSSIPSVHTRRTSLVAIPAALGRPAIASSLALVGSVVPLAATAASAVSPGLVISQVYGAGGNSGALFANDYVELFNRGNTRLHVGLVRPVRGRLRHRRLPGRPAG